jgi:hypothetical protein
MYAIIIQPQRRILTIMFKYAQKKYLGKSKKPDFECHPKQEKPFSLFTSKRKNLSIDSLNKEIEVATLKNKNIEMNACHKTAIQISIIDNGISKETKKQLMESLVNNYSGLYKKLMGVEEDALEQKLIMKSMKSGFLNFVKEDGSLCHTAYIKEYNGDHEYYHTNYTSIDKAIIDKCGMEKMKQIKGTSISHYSMDSDSVAAINEFMLLNNWRVSFCSLNSFS